MDAREPRVPGRRVLFLMRSLGTLRYFQSTLELLADRGHDVYLVLERDEHGAPEQTWLDGMCARPNVSVEVIGRQSSRWHRRGIALRAAMEYLHFRGAAFRNLPRYSLKALRRSPPASIRRLADLPLLRSPAGHALLYRVLAVLERAVPEPPSPGSIMRRVRPDVLVVGDAGNRDSSSPWFVRVARRDGIPSITCVASWDNLSTRPRMRTRPHRLAVWNREQLREAVTIHGVDAGSVIVTGAANFDQWFAWSPRPAEDFRRRVGLDLERPYVLWVCSALNKWEQPENVFFAQWLQALRTAEHAVLREAAVLLRPHPLRLDQWQEVDVAGYDGVVMWPRHDMTMPVDAEQKADYYDSIYHSRAVVGINTSAMIEASIIGRPVLTVLEPAHHDSQFGALHFSYLVELGGGLLRVAASLHEHLSDLAACIASRDSPAAAQGFVGEFVRPHGIDRPATALVVDAIESLAGTPVAAERDPIWLPVVRLVLRVASFVHGGRKSRAAIRKRLLSARTTIRKVAARAVRRGKRSRHRLARRARRARRLVWRLRQRSKDSLRSAGEV